MFGSDGYVHLTSGSYGVSCETGGRSEHERHGTEVDWSHREGIQGGRGTTEVSFSESQFNESSVDGDGALIDLLLGNEWSDDVDGDAAEGSNEEGCSSRVTLSDASVEVGCCSIIDLEHSLWAVDGDGKNRFRVVIRIDRNLLLDARDLDEIHALQVVRDLVGWNPDGEDLSSHESVSAHTE